MTFACKLFVSTLLTILVSLGMELLMCVLSLTEMGKDRGLYWDDEKEKLIVKDFEIDAMEYLDKIDEWHPNGRWIN